MASLFYILVTRKNGWNVIGMKLNLEFLRPYYFEYKQQQIKPICRIYEIIKSCLENFRDQGAPSSVPRYYDYYYFPNWTFLINRNRPPC